MITLVIDYENGTGARLPWFYLHGKAHDLSDYQDLVGFASEPTNIPEGISEAILQVSNSEYQVYIYAWPQKEGNIPLKGLVVLQEDEAAVAYAQRMMERGL